MNVCTWHHGKAVLKLSRRRTSCENLVLAAELLSGVFIEAGRLVEFSQRLFFFFLPSNKCQGCTSQ